MHRDKKTMLTQAIRTERLLLRSFRESDYDDLFEFLSQLEDDEFEGYPGITWENGREHLKYRLGSEERKEAWALMRKSRTRQSKMKAAAGICMLAAILFLLTGCGRGSAFDGFRVTDASGFRMEYSMLNREESADLNLTEGERLQVSLSHTEGNVDVTVELKGKEPIYRGTGQQNADFVLEILGTGNYCISVSGHQAKGNVSFIRIPGLQK